MSFFKALFCEKFFKALCLWIALCVWTHVHFSCFSTKERFKKCIRCLWTSLCVWTQKNREKIVSQKSALKNVLTHTEQFTSSECIFCVAVCCSVLQCVAVASHDSCVHTHRAIHKQRMHLLKRSFVEKHDFFAEMQFTLCVIHKQRMHFCECKNAFLRMQKCCLWITHRAMCVWTHVHFSKRSFVKKMHSRLCSHTQSNSQAAAVTSNTHTAYFRKEATYFRQRAMHFCKRAVYFRKSAVYFRKWAV